jgi:hypothetical protein
MYSQRTTSYLGGGGGAEKVKEAEAEAEAADKAEATTTTKSNWFHLDSTFFLFGVESIFF